MRGERRMNAPLGRGPLIGRCEALIPSALQPWRNLIKLVNRERVAFFWPCLRSRSWLPLISAAGTLSRRFQHAQPPGR